MNLIVNIKQFFSGLKRICGRDTLIGKTFSFIKRHLPNPNAKGYIAVFVLVLGAAAYIRFWAAPLSAGVDVPQFWAFAKIFEQYGLDFYRFAGATLKIFPVGGWAYVYPPMWLLILRLALLAAPGSTAQTEMVSDSWRLAMKTPIITADLAIGCLLFWAIPGSKLKKLIFASLWLLHPTAWYNSALFGQFDAIAAVLLLASVILLERGHDKWAFLLAALAVLTKQHVFIPVALIIVVCIRKLGWRRLAIDCAIFVGVVIAFSIPFVITGNFIDYAHSVFLPGLMPDYQTPLMYAFNGSSALLTYFHLYFGWNTFGYFGYYIPALIIAGLATLVLSYRRNITISQAALVGFLIFICFNYRINYQYLVIYIPLALWVAATTRYRFEKIFAIVMALVPAVWIWMFNDAFWFYYAVPYHLEGVKILERLGMYNSNAPDWAYVTLSMVLMGLYLAYIILVFIKWRKRPESSLLPPPSPLLPG